MRSFALAVQWTRGGIVAQEDGLTFEEAFDGWHGYMSAPRPPYRCAFALVKGDGTCQSSAT